MEIPYLRRLFLYGLLIACASRTAATQDKAHIRRLDGSSLSGSKASAIVRKTLADAQVTGAQISILNNGKVVWTEAFGLRDVAAKQPMTLDSEMWAASLTKSVFASYVMTLVDAGMLDLDKPVWQYLGKPLPQFDRYKDLAGDVRWRRITARQLLSHTSGLANYASMEPNGKMRIHWEPGTRYGYSGEGINLLQLVVETMMHKPLQQLMADRIFNPLGMSSTALTWRDTFAPVAASGYDDHGVNLGHSRRGNARAASSMDTTILDLNKFLEGLFAGRVMTPRAQSEMFRPQIGISALHQFPTLSDDKGTEGPAIGLSYGLGWGILSATKYGPAFFKEGHGEGQQNYMICLRQRGDCMVILTNSENGEAAFRPLLEKLFADTVTPWEWEGYTPAGIAASRANK